MYFLINLETFQRSKKTWKTYKGASRNASNKDIIATNEGFAWLKNSPNWAKSRLSK